MSERDYAPLSVACVRGLCDKIYEKRKFAGGEIEKMVKDFNDAKNNSQIRRLIKVLGQDLMSSTNPNVKNGALMGLSSVAVGLGEGGCAEYLSELLHPMVACLSESESRVRYQAVEALYNCVKMARGAALAQFPLLLDAVARLAGDAEPQVRQAAELLDRLVKDVATEAEGALDAGVAVRLLRERLYGRAPATRQLLASWVAVLDAAPALDLQPHLPDLLDPLFNMLDDPHPEIRRMVDVQLGEFLRGIKKEPARVNFQAMINVLITHAQSTDDLVQLTAITWMKEFVELSGGAMLPFASGVLAAVLPALAYTDEHRKCIRETAATVNLQLTKLVAEDPKPSEGEDSEEKENQLNLDAVVGVLTQMLVRTAVPTKVAALEWILRLYVRLPAAMYGETDGVFPCVVAALADNADEVVRRALAVLAEIVECDPGGAGGVGGESRLEASPYFGKFLRALVRLLAREPELLEERGALVVRQLCVLLEPERVYVALARELAGERQLPLAAAVVDVLAMMLLTAPELFELRRRLRAFDSPPTRDLFLALYRCWCHSPMALLALCLLTHNYAHCNELIATFGDLEITVDFLTEVDKLVQLIESPIFAYLRLELVSGEAALRRALYGLLMLLPQGDAFHALRRRLQCAPPLPHPPHPPHPPSPPQDTHTDQAGGVGGVGGVEGGTRMKVEFAPLLEQFHRVQAAHRRYRVLDAHTHTHTHEHP